MDKVYLMKEKHIVFRFERKVCALTSKIFRQSVVNVMKAENRISHCSIISSNCIGSLLSHDLGMRFETPTVNLFFSANDFITFVEKLDYYLSIPLVDVHYADSYSYPVGNLDNINIHFVHYKSIDECIIKWEDRKKRIDMHNLFLVCTDRNGMTDDLLNRFLRLPYRKIIFVSKKTYLKTDECIYIPGFEKNGQVCEMDKYADLFGHRYYEKYCNIVAHLNVKSNGK